MSGSDDSPRNTVSPGIHPVVYRAIVGLCLWLVLSAWGFLGGGYSALVLSVVSLFIATVVVLSLVLRHISRWHRSSQDRDATSPLGEWLSRDFTAWSGKLRGSEAAVEILLPIAAVAFGMSAFALVLHLAV